MEEQFLPGSVEAIGVISMKMGEEEETGLDRNILDQKNDKF